jgi:hypothetical protein
VPRYVRVLISIALLIFSLAVAYAIFHDPIEALGIIALVVVTVAAFVL